MNTARTGALVLTVGGVLALLLNGLFGPANAPVSSQGTAQTAAASSPAPTAVAQPAVSAVPQPTADLNGVRALRRAGLTAAAVSELRRWIVQNPKETIPADIVDLLKQLDDENLSIARANQAIGLPEAARTALLQWLQQHPDRSVPDDLRPLLPGPTDTPWTLARAYKRERLFDAAATEVQRWVQRRPDEKVPEDLRELLPTRLDEFKWWAQHSITPWFVPVLEGLAVVVLMFFMVSAMFGLGRPSLVIDDVSPGDEKTLLGKQISTAIRQQLAMPLGATTSLEIATGPVEPVTIPGDLTSSLASTLPLAQVFASAFKWTRRAVTVSGVRHPVGPRGVGMSLAAGEASNVQTAVTLWQAEYDPYFVAPAKDDDAAMAHAYFELVPAAASWLRFYMHDRYASSEQWPYTTKDWKSHAKFEAGIRLQSIGRDADAAVLYEDALRFDPDNLGARLNLALLLPDDRMRAAKIAQLEHVTTASINKQYDSTYYSAAFSLTMLLADVGRTPDARTQAAALVRRIDEGLALAKPKRRFGRRTSEITPFERYLRLIGPSARVMHAALSSQPLGPDIDPCLLTTEFQYNLACYYSMFGQATLTQSIERLEVAAALNPPKVAKAAEQDRMTVLRDVASDPGTSARFAAVLTPPAATPAPAPSALARLTLIGDARAAALAANGINSPNDLVVRCHTKAGCEALAQALGVSTATVLHWGRAAELLRIGAMQPPHVNALTLAALDSFDALRGVTTTIIATTLRDLGVAGAVPPDNVIDSWTVAVASDVSLVARA